MSGESSQPGPFVSSDIDAVLSSHVELLNHVAGVSLGELVALAAKRDQSAHRRLYDLTSGMVNAVALRVLGNREDAEEVVVDVYLRAWRNAPNFDPARGSPLSWLLMMTRSISIDKLRQRSARPQTLDDFAACGDLRSADPDPQQQTEQLQRQGMLRSAMAQLAPEQREVLSLAFYSGLSHAELAQQLGQPLGTVKTRIRLGLMHLRRILEHPEG